MASRAPKEEKKMTTNRKNRKAQDKSHSGSNFALERIQSTLCVAVCILSFLISVHGQSFSEKSPQRGTAVNSSLAIGDIETINLENGNLMYRMPIASLPPSRGGELNPTIYLNYNSKLYDIGVGRANRPCSAGSTFACASGDTTPPCGANDVRTVTVHWCIEEEICLWLPDGYGCGWFDRQCWDDRVELPETTPPPPTCTYPVNSLKVSREGGWQYGAFYELVAHDRPDTRVVSTVVDPNNPPPPFKPGSKTEIVFPDGSTHEIIPLGGTRVVDALEFFTTKPWSTTQPSEWYTTDGTYLRISYNPKGTSTRGDDIWTIHFGNGTEVTVDYSTGIQTTTDRNGNSFTTQNVTLTNGNPAIQVTDQLGRQIVVEKPGSGPIWST
jgi:hypothetical protein